MTIDADRDFVLGPVEISCLAQSDLNALGIVVLRELRYRHEWMHSGDGDVGDAVERASMLSFALNILQNAFANHSINGQVVFFTAEGARTAAGELWFRATERGQVSGPLKAIRVERVQP